MNLRTIFENISEAWILTDREGRVLLTSNYVEQYQYLLHQPLVPGQSIFDFIPGSWKLVARNVLTSLQEYSAPLSLEANHVNPDGKEMHVEFSCTGIRDQKGDLTHVFIQARDYTSQKIFEKKITILAREYQELIENANAVIIGLDARGYITDWNENTSQITGYSKSEAYIGKFADFLEPESRKNFADEMQKVLNGGVIANYEVTIMAKDGRRLTLLINATPKANAAAQAVGILLIGQDITELSDYRQSLEQKVTERTKALKSALESERQLVQVKDRFVSMASHEFRSPISYIHRHIGSIKANIEQLRPAELRDRLSKIESQAEHLSSLLEDVLTIGKTGANTIKLKANLKPVDLKEFLHRVIDEVVTNTRQTHTVISDFPFDSLIIKSDENLLRNIFVNLLTNAIKFSPGKNQVFLSVRECNEFVECKVTDQGLGIKSDDLSKIFDPFHRGSNVQAIKGTGLGLAIVKKAVETLGGDISVESKPEEGTTFIIQLNLS